MQSTNRPAKFLVPFAQNDSAKVEIPATTTDPGRFSQSLGSPPLTGMPPEAGGIPPQLEDFNGAINQIARGVWWSLGGGRFAYDATWAADALIGGYARGAVIPATLGSGTVGMGDWYNNTEANTANPDADGTGWVPGYHYGATALTGQTGGTLTLTPAQAAKRVITVAGTLTSNLVLVVPAWVYSWTFVNTTGGAFTVSVKNAATAAVVIPQNGAATPVSCDGTQVTLSSPNIAPATQGTQAMRADQAVGRSLRASASGSWTVPPTVTTITVWAVAPGGGGGSAGASVSGGSATVGGGGGGGGAGQALLATAYAVLPGGVVSWTIGTAGTGAPTTSTGNGSAGGNAGNLVISGSGFNGGTAITLTGGGGGGGGLTTSTAAAGAVGGFGYPQGGFGHDAASINSSTGAGGGGGIGASSPFGGGGAGGRGALGDGAAGLSGGGFGSGGGGGGGPYQIGRGTGGAGGNGSGGLIILTW